jgi:hypothetical protein
MATPVQGTRWLAPGEQATIRVGGRAFRLPGMLYVGSDMRLLAGLGPEPAVIDPALPIAGRLMSPRDGIR